MRIRHAVIVLSFAAVPLFAQEALPHAQPLVVLPVEVELTAPAPTLSSAAHANDFATFDTLFRASRPEPYRPLHELWTYSVTDPIGAFYGEELYARLASAYPSYAEFIAGHRIVDARGNSYYPSSETRSFLLARAEAGTLASIRIRPSREGLGATEVTALPAVTTRVRRPATLRVHAGATTTNAPAPARSIPQRAPAPAPRSPLSIPVLPPSPLPVIAPEPPALLRPEVVATSATATDTASGRGLLLVIIGLLGFGLLVLLLRAPREMPSVTPHKEA